MIKTIVIAHKKPSLTDAEFNRHWKEVHGPLAAKLIPGVRRYVQNHLVSVPGYQYEGNGIVEMWYDSLESHQKSLEFLRSPSAQELAQDAGKFCIMKPGGIWLVEEHVIKDELSKMKG
ncbi:MAG TPA: EthD family reductase [Dehalococcoidales bacterium]|nr:EthD family reductase [Dehalococcoidales bacterium]